MFVEVKVLGSPAETVDREFAPPAADTTLRALLAELVGAEVAGYERRRAQQRLLHVLTDRDIAAGTRAGKIVSGGREVPSAPPVDVALTRAVEAFGDGLFLAALDGAQLEDLDAPVTVGPTSRLRLIRLVALAGG